MRFVNIQTCKLLFEIGSLDEGISSSAISPHGRYIASIMENGSLNIYSVQTLTKEINKVCYQVNNIFFLLRFKCCIIKNKNSTLQASNLLAPYPLSWVRFLLLPPKPHLQIFLTHAASLNSCLHKRHLFGVLVPFRVPL